MFVYLNIAKKTLCHKPTHEKQAWTPLKNLYRLSKKTSPHYVLWYCNVSFDSSFRFLYFIPYKNPKLLLKLKPGAHWSYLLSVTRDSWRKQAPPVCGGILSDFSHACHRQRIFNMLYNFSHEWTFLPTVRTRKAITFHCRWTRHA
jgi:hypothetical protein